MQYANSLNPADTIVVGMAGTDGAREDAFTVDIQTEDAPVGGSTGAVTTIGLTSLVGTNATFDGTLAGSSGVVTVTYL